MRIQRSAIMVVMMLTPFLSGCFAGQDVGFKKPIQPEYGLLKGSPIGTDMPYGDDPYSQGVRDGCETMMQILGKGVMRNTLSPKLDGYRLSSDNDYQRGYTDGSQYCTFVLDWDTH